MSVSPLCREVTDVALIVSAALWAWKLNLVLNLRDKAHAYTVLWDRILDHLCEAPKELTCVLFLPWGHLPFLERGRLFFTDANEHVFN